MFPEMIQTEVAQEGTDAAILLRMCMSSILSVVFALAEFVNLHYGGNPGKLRRFVEKSSVKEFRPN